MVARSGPAEHPRHACAPTAAPSGSTGPDSTGFDPTGRRSTDPDPTGPDSTDRGTALTTCPSPHRNHPIGSAINVLGAAPVPYGLAMPDTAPLEDAAPTAMQVLDPPAPPTAYTLAQGPALEHVVPSSGPHRDPTAAFPTMQTLHDHMTGQVDPHQPLHVMTSQLPTTSGEASQSPTDALQLSAAGEQSLPEDAAPEFLWQRIPASWRGTGTPHSAHRDVTDLVLVLGWGMMVGFLLHLVPRTAPLGALVVACFAMTNPVMGPVLRKLVGVLAVVMVALVVIGSPTRSTFEQICWVCQIGALVMAPLSLVLADRELTPEIP